MSPYFDLENPVLLGTGLSGNVCVCVCVCAPVLRHILGICYGLWGYTEEHSPGPTLRGLHFEDTEGRQKVSGGSVQCYTANIQDHILAQGENAALLEGQKGFFFKKSSPENMFFIDLRESERERKGNMV